MDAVEAKGEANTYKEGRDFGRGWCRGQGRGRGRGGGRDYEYESSWGDGFYYRSHGFYWQGEGDTDSGGNSPQYQPSVNPG